MEKVKTICQLITSNFNIPAAYISETENETFGFSHHLPTNPLYQPQQLLQLKSEHFNIPTPFPRVRKNNFFEIFVLLSVFERDTFKGTLVLGPSLTTPLSTEQLLALIKDQHAFPLLDQITHYYQNLSIYSTKHLINLSVLLYYLLNNDVITAEQIQTDFLYVQTIADDNKEQPDYQSKFNSQHDQLFEKEILKTVRNGEVEHLNKHLIFKDEEEQVLYSKSSFLRSLKNHIITLAALTSRAAIDGGLQNELALRLCDTFILKVEEAQSRAELYRICAEMLDVFTRKVRATKEQHFSIIVKQAINFVYAHLYQPFTHKQIAEHIKVNPQYLSQIFKKETTQTLSHFIQAAKIEEAKHLLTSPQISVADAASALNFSDQSYFTKIFKQHTQLTPHQYRRRLN